MSNVYDNWERIVAAVLKKEELWILFHQQSRTPSICSESSSASSSFNYDDVPFSLLQKLVFVSDFNPAFNLPDLLGASVELLGNGTFGSAYKADMDNGITVVMKKLKATNVSEVEFVRHMKIVGDLKHENVVPLMAYFFSQDEKIMVYDHYTLGSVAELLHGANSEIHHTTIDWETRLRIATGAAKGLAHIHEQRGGKLVHGNIKSTNILLNSQKYGCVSDVGFSNMRVTKPSKISRFITRKLYSPTTTVSQSDDIFGFGVVLLELLTRKIHVLGDTDDLVMLVTSIKRREWNDKVFDVDLFQNPSVMGQMVKLLELGIRCVHKTPKKRPKMIAVLMLIEEINMMYSDNIVSMERNKLVFFDEVNDPFDLEDLLRASAEVLGKGTFGTSYKTVLENGVTVVVKRLKDVEVTKEEFRHHMEVIGRIQNENVAKLKAYYYSKDEKLVVYDYSRQDSVSVMLHGKYRGIGESEPFLDWLSRLRIAVGAARGIAHIHGLKLVHGNIKSSNIFINRQSQYGYVTDVGLHTLMSIYPPPIYLKSGYCAPEVTSIKQVSQVSDVYSFGVFLLELISGKKALFSNDTGKELELAKWIDSLDPNEWRLKVYDVALMRYQNKDDLMEKLLLIALNCIDVPVQRPKMHQVVKMLEKFHVD